MPQRIFVDLVSDSDSDSESKPNPNSNVESNSEPELPPLEPDPFAMVSSNTFPNTVIPQINGTREISESVESVESVGSMESMESGETTETIETTEVRDKKSMYDPLKPFSSIVNLYGSSREYDWNDFYSP